MVIFVMTEQSKFLYCRNCEIKTQHERSLAYDWGYKCRVCACWQHQSQLASIQQGYVARLIQKAIQSEDIEWHEGDLEEFIEAAQALDMDYDYQKTPDGYDFIAWNLENDEKVARIKL